MIMRKLFLLFSLSFSRQKLCLLCCCLLLAAAASGCVKTTIKPDASPGGPPPLKLSPLDEARAAFAAGKHAQAEAIALRLVEESATPGGEGVEAGRILAASALKNKHPHVALKGLDFWRKASSEADQSKEWQDAWCMALRDLSSHDARSRANAVYQDSSRNLQTRSIAGVYMAVRQWQDGELAQSMPALENIYASAQNTRNRASIESRLALELSKAPAGAASLAASAVTRENQGNFPYTIIRIDQLRRQAMKADTRESAQAALRELKTQIRLADPGLFDALPRESSISISAPSAAPAALPPSVPVTDGRPVALLLPMSGQYADISAKIAAGARVACEELSSSGAQVPLLLINTEQADWLAQAEALPASVVALGGPLRRADYAKAKNGGLLTRRVLFAFLPSLDSNDEGRLAWRFFSGAKDQVDTLLKFASRLGISSYGIFHPQDTFGQRMAALFEERARAQGAQSVVSGSYEPGNQSGWTVATNNLLAASKKAPFKAMFLPDSWKNMDIIISNFFYYNENRQLLMGPALWEQGLSGSPHVSLQYYKLAVFPGAWNNSAPSKAGERLQAGLSAAGKGAPDFWTGLGYDFARFSAGLGLSEGWTPERVNSALAAASSFDWSMAPIAWTNGMAAQEMFLFTPRERGFASVDEAAFKAAFEEAWRQGL